MDIKRMYGLDLLRCLLMLIGPIVHTGSLFKEDMDIIPEHSIFIKDLTYFAHPFRMELFFLISGFFTSLVLAKKGSSYFRNSRKIGLYIPTVTALLIILPLTHLIFQKFSNNGQMTFYHLWFLIVLSLINFIPMARPEAYEKVIKKLTTYSFRILVPIALVSYLVFLFLPVFIFKLFPTDNILIIDGFYTFVSLPLLYSVPFIAGGVVFHAGSSLVISNKRITIEVATYALIYGLTCMYPYKGLLQEKIVALFLLLLQVIISTRLILSLFHYFKNLDLNKSPFLNLLTSSALTIYLIHQPITFISGFLFRDLTIPSYAKFALICATVYLASFAFFLLVNSLKTTRMAFGIKQFKKG